MMLNMTHIIQKYLRISNIQPVETAALISLILGHGRYTLPAFFPPMSKIV
jgi:hypothetical protein